LLKGFGFPYFLGAERKEIIAKIMIVKPRIAYISMPRVEPLIVSSNTFLL